jgi:hypothetical protein
MHSCPNCDASIAPHAISCPRCGAVFGEGASWQPLSPTERNHPRRPTLLQRFGGLVLAGACFVPSLVLVYLIGRPELLKFLLLLSLSSYAAGYCIWSGWTLIQTQDFTGWKIGQDIPPSRVDAAARYFGVWSIVMGGLFLCANLFYFLPQSQWVFLLVPYALCVLAVLYGLLRYG